MLLLQIFVWISVLLPARLVLEPVGSFGSPASVVGLLAFLFWASAALRPDLLQRRVWPIRVTVLGLVVPSVLSYAVLHLHAVPADELNSADRWLLFLMVWSGVALLAAEGLASMNEVLRLLRVLVAAAATESVIALAQSRLGVDASTWGVKIPGLSIAGTLDSVLLRSGYLRPAGTATHPLELGTLLAFMLAPALVLAFYDLGWSAARRWTALLLIAVGIPVALSRSALITAAIVLLFWLAGSGRKVRIQSAIGLLGIVVVLFLTTPGLLGTLQQLFAGVGGDTSVSTRTDDYAAVAHLIRHSPLLGHGPATFLPKYRILDNQWLATIIETGVVGALGLAVFFLGPAFVGRSVWHQSADPLRRQLGHALAASSCALAVAAFTYDLLSFPLLPGLFAVTIGIGGAIFAIDKADRETDAVARSEQLAT